MANFGKRLLGLTGPTPVPVIEAKDTYHLNSQEMADSIKSWEIYMGPIAEWKEDNFMQIIKLAQTVTSKQSRLVILDLPLPKWHRDASPYFQLYEIRKSRFIDEIKGMPNVTFSSLQNSLADEDFYDSGHPRPKDAIKLARAAAKIIAPALELTTEPTKLQDDSIQNRSTTATKQSPPNS